MTTKRKLAKDETLKEKKERFALEKELKKLPKGSVLPDGYEWKGDDLINPYGINILNPPRAKSMEMKDNMSLKEMLIKHNGKNLNQIFSKISRIAKGLEPKNASAPPQGAMDAAPLHAQKPIIFSFAAIRE